ncbi:hypothetical protein DENSPDRAFT_886712 [Dentipellis sp. KUC8613]|nr:hypothetical protein DENSPDRAFT_886712 [Dentipellis sp. KUC8613]
MPHPAVSHPTAPSRASAAPSHSAAVPSCSAAISRSHCCLAHHTVSLTALSRQPHRLGPSTRRLAAVPLAGASLGHLSPRAAIVCPRDGAPRPLPPHLCRSAAHMTGLRASAAPPSAQPKSLVCSRRHLAPRRRHTRRRTIVPPSPHRSPSQRHPYPRAAATRPAPPSRPSRWRHVPTDAACALATAPRALATVPRASPSCIPPHRLSPATHCHPAITRRSPAAS